METNEHHQNLELQALKSIYPDVFFESAPPKAWKDAARLPEFNIKVTHDPNPNIFFILNVKFPKAYPSKAMPILSITQSKGVTPTQVTTLMSLMHSEAQRCLGGEAIFSIVMLCEEWLKANIKVPKEAGGLSLAIEMQNRALEEEKALKEKEVSLAKAEDAKEAQLAEQLLQQIEQDALRKEEIQRQENERQRARRRALSDATEKPIIETSIETFDNEVEAFGVCFDSVRLYHGRREFLGITYNAEPVCDDPVISAALELHVIVFEAGYYKSQPGKKKIAQVENEIRRLTKLDCYDHVLRVFAVQLTGSKLTESSRLAILMEKRPSLILKDLLQDCDGLREDRVKSYLLQICSGLRAIHDSGLVHRAINPASIGLVEHVAGAKVVKLMRTSFYTRLHDLHKSDPIGVNAEADAPEPPLPDDWLFHEVIESPLLYTRCRDIHSVGVLALQMLMGLDVTSRYPNPRTALQDSSLSHGLNQILSDILRLSKRSAGTPSAGDVLERLGHQSLELLPKPQTIPINGLSNQSNAMKTPVARFIFPTGSPEKGYFLGAENRTRRASRWREDWEQLEVLGKGGFGSVVKAKNRLDGQVYAVKKIKLRTAQGDNKIFREVNALSRLSHRFIVRYYTTWLEESEPTSSNVSSDSEQEGFEDADDQTAGAPSTQTSDERSFDPTSIDLNELVLREDKTTSFPSIHFTSGDVADDSSDEEEMDSQQLVKQLKNGRLGLVTPPHLVLRTLYIQMEYVERQTLKERIAEGISEDEAWRLFQQIVDALVHMASLGILHRDIKLTNIFIDSNGDCKVGDFGLATSSLAAVDPSDVSPMSVATFSDMTLDVGTRLYIAPEILSKRGGSRDKDHSKADLYSLGIVFFEMNYMFRTASERIVVIENLRHPEIIFPVDWDDKRSRQRAIIQWLLRHDPSQRPTALKLSQSPLLPPRLEDEYFKEALQLMTNRENRHYPAVLASLFSQPPRPSFHYDQGYPETAILRHGVVEHLDRLFRLHGARDVDVPLLMPLTDKHTEIERQALLLDTYGEIVTLPSNALLPFARLAARKETTRIKRYHVGDTYRTGNAISHPVVSSAAIFDIITPDTLNGLEVASAEMIALMDECLGTFPNLAKTYQIHVSHSKISEIIMGRIPERWQTCVIEVLQTIKASTSQRRATLQKKGLPKTVIDEVEWLYEDYEDITMPLMRLEKNSSALAEPLAPLLREVQKVVGLAVSTGLQHSIVRVQPLMIGRRHDIFKDGVCFEVVNATKRTDILAVGGRYDRLVRQFYSPLSTKKEPFVAVCLQIALERITSAIATFQKNFLIDTSGRRSYDYWSARRCDVYVVSFQPGHLSVRLEVAALLWRHGIRADLMYETAVSDTNMEGLADLCYNEGILFTLYPKLKAGQREPTDFKVKSVLRGTEYEIPRQELVPWLQQQISEQKKIDSVSAGVTGLSSELVPSASTSIKDNSSNVDLQLVLPGEGTSLKKQRRTIKQLFFERAYEKRMRLKSTMQSGSLPMLAVDVLPAVFDALVRSDAWVTDDDVWRTIASGFPTQHMTYANQIRDAVARKKSEGMEFLILFAVKEERIALLSF